MIYIDKYIYVYMITYDIYIYMYIRCIYNIYVYINIYIYNILILMVEQMFLSPQMKRSMIISNKLISYLLSSQAI